MATSYFENYFGSIATRVSSGETQALLSGAKLLADTSMAGGRIILAGNGGSAAMASHVTVDLLKAAKIRAINFNEADLITCFANDYGYERWLEEALKAYGERADLAVLISSSGQSANMLNAAKEARRQQMKIMTLTGFDATNPLRKMGDINFWVDSSHYNTVEMTHHIWLLSMVDFIAEQADS
jgi:D-sedoheptulose 7-phosphate isomerase